PGPVNKMDLAAGKASTDNPIAPSHSKQQIALEIKKLREAEAKKQVDLIRGLVSNGHDYAFIEKYLNDNDVHVNSTIRQEIWLTINHESLSKLLREQHSAVRSPISSDPATFGNHQLNLTL